MKVITDERYGFDGKTYIATKDMVKSPASLTPAEKIQLLEEMGIDVDRWYTKIYYGNHIGKDLRQYIEEHSAKQGEEMK
jgi:hypothetical protein